jgi:hypothetical protein
MDTLVKTWFVSFLIFLAIQVHAQTVQKVVDVPARSGVSQRMLVLSPPDPCEAFAYHGFNGLERDVVGQTAAWILAK